MNGPLNPFYRSFRDLLNVAGLLGAAIIGLIWLGKTLFDTHAELESCYASATLQAEELTRCRNLAAELTHQNDALKIEKMQAEEETAIAAARIIELEKQLKASHALIIDLQEEIRLLTTWKFEHARMIDQLLSQLEAKGQEQLNTQDQLEQTQQEVTYLRGALNGLLDAEYIFRLLRENTAVLSILIAAVMIASSRMRGRGGNAPLQPRTKSPTSERIWVCMTRDEARNYARLARYLTQDVRITGLIDRPGENPNRGTAENRWDLSLVKGLQRPRCKRGGRCNYLRKNSIRLRRGARR